MNGHLNYVNNPFKKNNPVKDVFVNINLLCGVYLLGLALLSFLQAKGG